MRGALVNALTKQERAGSMLGVAGRFFGIVQADNGRILNQKFKATRYYEMNGRKYRITAELRLDDECGNGHETFSVTADIRENGQEYMCGCCHDEVARHFPELAPLIKWHLTSTDGPIHYIANTVYHADEHGPDHAWVYYTAQGDPLNIGGNKERLLAYARKTEALAAECMGAGYRVQWDEKTAKVRNLDYARSSAVWPDATDEDLTAPGLRERLIARHPALMAAFKADMIACGFMWPEVNETVAA